jgi:hypothetical protein
MTICIANLWQNVLQINGKLYGKLVAKYIASQWQNVLQTNGKMYCRSVAKCIANQWQNPQFLK